MSRVFEALRNAEQNKPGPQALQKHENEPDGQARPPGEPAVEKSSEPPKEEQRAVASSVEELGALAVRLEASRGYLESLIADARRVRESLEKELRRTYQSIQDSNREALRAVAADVKAEFVEEIEAVSQGAADRVERRVAEKTGEALDSLARAADARLSSVTAEWLDRSRKNLSTLARASEIEASTRLQNAANSVVDSAVELLRKRMDESLNIFREALVSSGQRLITQSDKTIAEFTETARQALNADLEKAPQKGRGLVPEGLPKDLGGLEKGGLADTAMSGEVNQEAGGQVHKQVDPVILAITEWQDQARATLETNFQESVQTFLKHVSDLSAEIADQHRQTVRYLLNGLEVRMEQAAHASEGNDITDRIAKGEAKNQ
jgi:hypothetical protein